MDTKKATFEIARMARLLEVSRSGYYAWTQRQTADETPAQQRRHELTVKIRQFHLESDQVYGSPRITADLREAGETVSAKTVAKLMAANGIVGISPRKFTPVTTVAGLVDAHIPDLVCRDFDRGRLNAVWMSDITYLDTDQGWLYLCAVRDGCSRRVLGWAIDDHMRTDLVEQALRMAHTMRGDLPDQVIFHADRGCQYTSAQLGAAAAELGLAQSVGRTGVCWDNSMAESFFASLKNELTHHAQYDTFIEAGTEIANYIELFYNQTRLHSALGYRPPNEIHYGFPTSQVAA